MTPQPPNGPQPPPQNPRELPAAFAAWPTLAACIAMDGANDDLQRTVGRLVFLGQMELANEYAAALQHLLEVREKFYQEKQGAISLHQPGELPKR